MKSSISACLTLAALLAALSFSPPACAEQPSPDDNYLAILSVIQQGDSLAEKGQAAEALGAFADAQKRLQQFQKQFPAWDPGTVQYRLNYLAEKTGGAKTASAIKPAPAVTPEKTAPSITPELQAQLEYQINYLRAENDRLHAKLREALGVLPAASDPAELAKAREQILWLTKENDLFKMRIQSVKFASSNAVTATNVVLVTNIVTKADAGVVKAWKQFQEEHAEVLKQLSAEKERSGKLAAEISALKKGKTPVVDPAALAAAQKEIAALQSQVATLELEKAALIERLRQISSETNPAASGAGK